MNTYIGSEEGKDYFVTEEYIRIIKYLDKKAVPRSVIRKAFKLPRKCVFNILGPRGGYKKFGDK